MSKDLQKKDIHSNKVRNIMLEKPPVLIRYGMVIIAFLLFALAVVVSNIYSSSVMIKGTI